MRRPIDKAPPELRDANYGGGECSRLLIVYGWMAVTVTGEPRKTTGAGLGQISPIGFPSVHVIRIGTALPLRQSDSKMVSADTPNSYYGGPEINIIEKHMNTRQQVTLKTVELEAKIQEATNRSRTKTQDLALRFASRIVSGSRASDLLIESGATIEAHLIGRLLLEHLFNLGAILSDKNHYDLLLQHSGGEPSRQLKQILQEHDQKATLTEENEKKLKEFFSDPTRGNVPTPRLNWEQIARSGQTDCLYVVYKEYSFLYAHSTMISLLTPITDHTIDLLSEHVLTVLAFACLLLRDKFENIAENSGVRS